MCWFRAPCLTNYNHNYSTEKMSDYLTIADLTMQKKIMRGEVGTHLLVCKFEEKISMQRFDKDSKS